MFTGGETNEEERGAELERPKRREESEPEERSSDEELSGREVP